MQRKAQPAGRRRERVAFDAPAPTQNSTGEEVNAWTLATTVWGELEVVGGSERASGEQILPEHDARIRVLWSSEIAALTPKHRARIGSRIFNIVHLPPRPAGAMECVMLCRSGTDSG